MTVIDLTSWTNEGACDVTKIVNPRLGEKDEWWVTPTPVGHMLVAGDSEWLHFIGLPQSFDESALDPDRRGTPDSVEEAVHQIEAYFDHGLRNFELPLQPAGTEFQRRVWFALGDIGYGETESYGQLAARVGNPKACRAVGLANGRNPIPLVLPCHRVIGSNGSLTGYGGGLDLKKWLLDHEASVVAAG
jgi:methylated-DNA-[protein]-cysteine S-methyltransferase